MVEGNSMFRPADFTVFLFVIILNLTLYGLVADAKNIGMYQVWRHWYWLTILRQKFNIFVEGVRDEMDQCYLF